MVFSTANVKGIFFDVDDTLYNERTFVRSGFEAVAAHLQTRFGWDADLLVREMIHSLAEHGRGRIFNTVLGRRGVVDDALVQELIGVYRTHKPVIQLFPDVAPVLERLRRRGYKLGLVTDGHYQVQLRKIEALGLLELVDVAIRTDELGPEFWKPHVKPFQRGLQALELQANEVIYVGNDASKDFQAPRQLGMGALHIERYVDVVGPCRGCLAQWHGRDLYCLVELLQM